MRFKIYKLMFVTWFGNYLVVRRDSDTKVFFCRNVIINVWLVYLFNGISTPYGLFNAKTRFIGKCLRINNLYSALWLPNTNNFQIVLFDTWMGSWHSPEPHYHLVSYLRHLEMGLAWQVQFLNKAVCVSLYGKGMIPSLPWPNER